MKLIMFRLRLKRTDFLKACAFGCASLALYGLVFAYAAPLTALFAKGGFYCLLPVMTVFIISYVHGTFAGKVWAALGVGAACPAPLRKAGLAVKRAHRHSRALTRRW